MLAFYYFLYIAKHTHNNNTNKKLKNMNTIRKVAIMGMKRAATKWLFPAGVVIAKRFHMHQNNDTDDMTWIEANKKMSAEEKYAFFKQQQLLNKQAESINDAHNVEHVATRAAFESHAKRSEVRIDELEAKIESLKEMLKQKKN